MEHARALPRYGRYGRSSTIWLSVLRRDTNTKCATCTRIFRSTSTSRRITRLGFSKWRSGMAGWRYSRALWIEGHLGMLLIGASTAEGTLSAKRLFEGWWCIRASMWKRQRRWRMSWSSPATLSRTCPRVRQTCSRYVGWEIRIFERYNYAFSALSSSVLTTNVVLGRSLRVW